MFKLVKKVQLFIHINHYDISTKIIISLIIFCVRTLRVILCIFFNNLKAYHFRVNALSSIYLKREGGGGCHLAIKKVFLPNIHYF